MGPSYVLAILFGLHALYSKHEKVATPTIV